MQPEGLGHCAACGGLQGGPGSCGEASRSRKGGGERKLWYVPAKTASGCMQNNGILQQCIPESPSPQQTILPRTKSKQRARRLQAKSSKQAQASQSCASADWSCVLAQGGAGGGRARGSSLGVGNGSFCTSGRQPQVWCVDAHQCRPVRPELVVQTLTGRRLGACQLPHRLQPPLTVWIAAIQSASLPPPLARTVALSGLQGVEEEPCRGATQLSPRLGYRDESVSSCKSTHRLVARGLTTLCVA